MIALEKSLVDRVPLRVPPQAIFTLTLMQKFHRLLDEPSYGSGSGFEPAMLERVKRMLGVARKARMEHHLPIDVPFVPLLGYLPAVPSWTVSRLEALRIEELGDPWAGERYWLQERQYDPRRASKDLGDCIRPLVEENWYEDEAR